jgi:predicted Zn-dependent protease with MMP-like domain
VNIGGHVIGGAGGIRTLDTVLPYTHFPGERLRPLGHRSAIRWKGAHVGKEAQSGNLAGARLQPLCRLPMRRFGNPPSADEMEAIARRALDSLPEPFAGHLREVVLLIEDFADEETLSAMGIDEPFDLTGIYEGIPITERSVDHSGTLPDRIRLFRRPILDEWADGDDTLEHLVAHVLVHEVGHHFGLSDDDMHALEDAVA